MSASVSYTNWTDNCIAIPCTLSSIYFRARACYKRCYHVILNIESQYSNKLCYMLSCYSKYNITRSKKFSPKNKKDLGMACHIPPLKKAKKQGEMPLPSLSPIPLTNVEFRDGMGHCCTEIVVCMHGNGSWICLVMVGQLNPGVWVLGFNRKKGSKLVVMMDLDQNLFPSTASFGAPFCFHG